MFTSIRHLNSDPEICGADATSSTGEDLGHERSSDVMLARNEWRKLGMSEAPLETLSRLTRGQLAFASRLR